MDTERFITSKYFNDIDNIILAEFSEVELNYIEHHIELTRYIQEINQLFKVFRFNLKNMLNCYTLMITDRIERTEHIPPGFDDFIAINSLTINYISSGKILIESLRNCVEICCGTNSDEFKYFKNELLQKTYDSCFNYRYIIRLRDFSQHCHLPISYQNGLCCFDLTQIINTPHFNHNKTLEKQLREIESDIISTYGDAPRLSFTLTLAEYNLEVTTIYKSFLSLMKNEVHLSEKRISELIDLRPEIITYCTDFKEGVVCYKVDNNMLHLFNVTDSSMIMFNLFEKEADDIYVEEKNEFSRLQNSYKKE